MTFKDWLKWASKHRDKLGLMPDLQLNDGVELSVQASKSHMSYPQEILESGEYENVEVYTHGLYVIGLCGKNEPFPYRYGYLSIDFMETLCRIHGGIKLEIPVIIYEYKLTNNGIACKEHKDLVFNSELDRYESTGPLIKYFPKNYLNSYYPRNNSVILENRDDEKAQTLWLKHCTKEFTKQHEFLSKAQKDLYDLIQNQIDWIYENPIIME